LADILVFSTLVASAGKWQRRQLRQDYILLRVATVCAVGLVAALVVVFLIMIATHV